MASVGAAFALFAAVNLLALLFVPGEVRGIALLPPVIAAVVVLFTLPALLRFFERQQERIEWQDRQITTQHTMHTAILSELELPSLLEVAARQAATALDAEQSGIVVETPRGPVEAFFNTSPEQQGAVRTLVREPPDASEDWEVARMPIRQGGGVQGHIVAVKRKPCKPFSDSDRTVLTTLVRTVQIGIGNAQALESARELARMESDLVRERRITQAFQEALLPVTPTGAGDFLFSNRYAAHSDESQVGGDIYDLFALGGGRWAILIADVSGKGLAAARKTALVKYALRSFAREHASPADVLHRLNNVLCDEPNLAGFVTLLYGVLSEADGSFQYASAGHETPILLRANDGGCEVLEPTGTVLGALPEETYGEAQVRLTPGDGLLLYTDGLTEARSPDGTFLEVEGLARMLAAVDARDSADMADVLLSRVREYADGQLSDDVAILWIQRLPAQKLPLLP